MIMIDSLQPESCPVATTAPPTDLPINPPTDSETDVTVVVVAVCVRVLLVVATVIVGIVHSSHIVFCKSRCMKDHKRNHSRGRSPMGGTPLWSEDR